jgi:hypothetical protein
MRSIGKRYIKLVKETTLKILKQQPNIARYSGDNIVALVTAKLPDKLWDTWEMADSEITRVIMDTVSEYDRSR